MKNGKQAKSTVRKLLAAAAAIILVCCFSVGGTLAWLSSQSETVVNTFTAASLFADPENDFTLYESEAVPQSDGSYVLDSSTKVLNNSYSLLPGLSIPKDPTVEIKGLKEDAYIFISVSNALPEDIECIIDGCWTHIGNNVYAYIGTGTGGCVQAPVESLSINVIKDKTITVEDSFNGKLDTGNELSFTAYAVQAEGFAAAAAAWTATYGAGA